MLVEVIALSYSFSSLLPSELHSAPEKELIVRPTFQSAMKPLNKSLGILLTNILKLGLYR